MKIYRFITNVFILIARPVHYEKDICNMVLISITYRHDSDKILSFEYELPLHVV